MKKLVLGSVALIALGMVAPAVAADMPVKVKAPPPVAVYDWSGFYLGFSAGWAQADVNRFYDIAPSCGTGLGTGQCNFSTSADGAIFDVHFGAQYEWLAWAGGGIVLGIEGSFNIADRELKGTTVLASPPFSPNLAGTHKVTQIDQVGGRLGLAWDRWMIYGTGGWAAAHIDSGFQFASTGLATFFNFSGDSYNHGWFAGVGLEGVIYKGSLVDVIVGAEYVHYEFDTKRAFCFTAACGGLNDFSVDATVDAVRARLSIKTHGFGFFWDAPPAVKAKY